MARKKQSAAKLILMKSLKLNKKHTYNFRIATIVGNKLIYVMCLIIHSLLSVNIKYITYIVPNEPVYKFITQGTCIYCDINLLYIQS